MSSSAFEKFARQGIVRQNHKACEAVSYIPGSRDQRLYEDVVTLVQVRYMFGSSNEGQLCRASRPCETGMPAVRLG